MPWALHVSVRVPPYRPGVSPVTAAAVHHGYGHLRQSGTAVVGTNGGEGTARVDRLPVHRLARRGRDDHRGSCDDHQQRDEEQRRCQPPATPLGGGGLGSVGWLTDVLGTDDGGRAPVRRRPLRSRRLVGGGRRGAQDGVLGGRRLRRAGNRRRVRSGLGGAWVGGGVPRSPRSPHRARCRAWGGCPAPAAGRTPPDEQLADQRDPRRPPTSSDRGQVGRLTPAERSARRSRRDGLARAPARIMSSSSARVSRTDGCGPAAAPGSTSSVSTDSASLASTQSRRSRASAAVAVGVVRVQLASAVAAARRATCRNTASSKSMPPRCSMPSGGPRMLEARPRLRAAPQRRTCRRRGRRRPPCRPGRAALAAAYCDRGRLAARCRCTRPSRSVGQRDRLVEQVALVGAPVRRMGQHDSSGAAALPLGDRARPPTRSSRAVRACGENGGPADQDRDGVADPPLELADHAVRLGGPRRSAASPTRKVAVRLR